MRRLLVGTHLAVRDGQGRELRDPSEGRDDVHDVDRAGLWFRTGARRAADLKDSTDDVGSRVRDIGDALGDVEAAVALLVLVALDL